MSEYLSFKTFVASKYSFTLGNLPNIAETVANSAEPKNTSAPLPKRFGKLRVEVEITWHCRKLEPDYPCISYSQEFLHEHRLFRKLLKGLHLITFDDPS